MKLAILAYVPPPSIGHPQVFIDNIRKFQTRYPVMLFSDHAYPDVTTIQSPEPFKHLEISPGQVNKFACHNAVFFTAVRIAIAHKLTHILWMEPDCRVGCDYWDEKMVKEAFLHAVPWICAGSMAVYNPCNAGSLAAQRWNKLLAQNVRKNFPIPTYGFLPAAVKAPSCVFVNGAIAIYSVAWLTTFFDTINTMELAKSLTAFDMAIGMKIWDMFGAASYDLVRHLNCIYSGYGEALTTEEERMEMLRSGKIVACHQVKSQATI